MTFQQLLDGAEILSQSGDPGVSGVEYDSRRVKPGCVFVAMRGESSDGNRFIDQAIQAGAAGVVTDSASEKVRERSSSRRWRSQASIWISTMKPVD